MDNRNDLFHPESVNEQVEYLARIQGPQQESTPGAPTIAELQRIYQEDEVILQRAWARLAGVEAATQPPGKRTNSVDMPHNRGERTMQKTPFFSELEGPLMPSSPTFVPPPGRAHDPRRPRWRTLSLVAVVLIVLVNIVTWTWIMRATHSTQVGTTSTTTVAPSPMGKQRCSVSLQGAYDLGWSSRGEIAVERVRSGRITTQIINPTNCSSIKSFSVSDQDYRVRLGLAWSPDGQRLLLAGDAGMILDATSGKELVRYYPSMNLFKNGTHDTQVYSSSWSPDSRFIASIVETSLSQTAAHGQSVQIWDARNGTLVRTLLTGLNNGPADQVAWSPDGKYIAVTEESFSTNPTNYDDVSVWDASTGQLVLHFKPLKNNPHHLVLEPGWNNGQGERIAWSPDGKHLATGSQDLVQVWNIPTGQLAFAFKTGLKEPSFDGLAWSPNGKYIAVAAYFGMRLWDVQAGKLIYSYPLHTLDNYGVSDIAWSPDSTLLATVTSALDSRTQQESDMLRIWGA